MTTPRQHNQRQLYQKIIIESSGLITQEQLDILLNSQGEALSGESDSTIAYVDNWAKLGKLNPYLDFSHEEYIQSIGGANQLLGLSPLAHAIQSKYFIHNNAKPRILYISHDASLTGAPAVLLEMIKATNALGWQSQCLIGGTVFERIKQFQNETNILHLQTPPENHQRELAEFLVIPPDVIYANTVASAALLEASLRCMPASSKPLIVSHVHELANVQLALKAETTYICEKSDIIIAVSDMVSNSLKSFHAINKPSYLVVPAFIDCGQEEAESSNDSNYSATKHTFLNVDNITTIFCCGTIENRKGFDLFCKTAANIKNSVKIDPTKVRFCWIGKSSSDEEPRHSMQLYDVEDIVECIGQHENPASLYRNGDIFFMCSREDPFPLVCIEAASKGLPVVCFDERAGGIASFVREGHCGLICEYLNCEDSTICLEILITDRELRRNQGKNAKNNAKNYHPSKKTPVITKFIENGLLHSSKHALFSQEYFNITIVSFAPPPVNPKTIVEGGGLRCWGLACGIKLARPEWNVRLIFPAWYSKDPQAIDKGYDITSGIHQLSGVELDTWSDEQDLVNKCKTSNIVFMSFCYGNYSARVASELADDQLLVFDCYVPIYPEVCARNAPTLIAEHRQYLNDLPAWNQMITRGDILLCANEQQLSFYYGVLFSSGSINPINYKSFNRLIVAPYGICAHGSSKVSRPMNKLRELSPTNPLKILWFGGVYPWFNIEDLIRACLIVNDNYMPCHLTIAGALNPFNNHPLFTSKAEHIMNLCQQSKYCDIVELVEWIPYSQRLTLYENSDFVVALNQDGIENIFAWRTRIVDYLEHNLVFATNGGDPLSDRLIETGLGFKIDTNTIETLAHDLAKVGRTVTSLIADEFINSDKLSEIRNELLWQNICNSICQSIESVNFQRASPN